MLLQSAISRVGIPRHLALVLGLENGHSCMNNKIQEPRYRQGKRRVQEYHCSQAWQWSLPYVDDVDVDPSNRLNQFNIRNK